jgi:hypothetical protein
VIKGGACEPWEQTEGGTTDQNEDNTHGETVLGYEASSLFFVCVLFGDCLVATNDISSDHSADEADSSEHDKKDRVLHPSTAITRTLWLLAAIWSWV